MTAAVFIGAALLLAGLWLRDKAIEARWEADDARFAELEGKLRAIGCSSTLVYYALSPDHYVKRAKGWELRWLKPGDAEWARAAGGRGGPPGEETQPSRYNQKAPGRRGQRRHTA